MGKNRKSGQHIFVYIISSIVISILFSLLSYSNIKEILYKEIAGNIINQTLLGVGQLENEIDFDLTQIESIAHFVEKYEKMHSEKKLSNYDDFWSEIEYCKRQNGYDMLLVSDIKGRGHLDESHEVDISEEGYFKECVGSLTASVSDPIYDSNQEKKLIVFSCPIFKDGKVIGAVVAKVSVKNLYEPFSVPIYGGKGYSYVVNGRGDIITASSYGGMEAEGNLFDIIDKGGNGGNQAEEIKSKVKSGGSWTNVISDGTRRYYICHVPIGIEQRVDREWQMVSVVPEKVILRNINGVVSYMGFLCIMLSCGVIIVTVILWKSRKIYQNHVEHLAFYDDRTGLFNKNYLLEKGEIIFHEDSGHFAVVVLDIDNFKFVNEVYGRDAGDSVLRIMGQVIIEETGNKEISARISNDNFAMLLQLNSKDALEVRVKNILKKFGYELKENGLGHININYSVGIFIEFEDRYPVDKMVDYADMARKSVKDKGGRRIEFFDEEVFYRQQERRKIEDAMENALKKGEFIPYFQPKVAFSDGSVQGAEALVRWRAGNGHIKAPDSFIPIFEQNGFILKLDYFMFEETCKIKKRWLETGVKDVTVSVNMSRSHLSQDDFVDKLVEIADKYGIERSGLEIEITESVYVEDINLMLYVLQKLKDVGFLVSMDDFGTGYSSLSLLKDLPIDCIKMDKGFLDLNFASEKGNRIIKSIVDMANSIDVDMVCEGVETQEQADFLRGIGCKKAQGYFYSRPVPCDEFEEFCRKSEIK